MTGREKVNYVKWIKLSIAVPLSMVIARAFGLNYTSSAGIITLLTVQDTKKETLEISVKRMIAFLIMTALCLVVFRTVGYHIASYAVFLCPFLFLCFRMKLDAAITMNAVLASHYLADGQMNPAAIGNEAALLLIGAGMGVAVNLVMPENIKKIRSAQENIDAAMKRILERMSIYLCREDRSDYTGECFTQVDDLLVSMEKEAKIRMQNTFTKGDTYFLSYMQMRMRQCEKLKDIYTGIMQLTSVPVQAKALSIFLKEISESFHEKNNVEHLMESLAQMRSTYKISELPGDREEFENRAVLMQITRDLESFLRMKREFVENLTEEEEQKYWKDGKDSENGCREKK